jgi:hypothetical protein
MARNDVSFSAIELKAPGSDQYINILEQFQSSSTFGGMSINEGLFETGISGFIILNDPDPSNTSSVLPSISNLVTTGTMLKLTFSTSVDTIESSVNGLELYVYNVSVVSDLSPGIATMGSSQTVTYRLEFTSYESSLINYETDDIVTLDGDYVASISDFIKEITSSEEGSGLMAPSDENAEIKNTTQIEPEIFSTYNGVWFKRNQSLYPWGKEKTIPSINTLIQSTLNYAIPTVGLSKDDDGKEEDPGVAQESNPSYVFYQSLPYGQWHYVPIGGGISDESNTDANDEPVQSLYNKSYVNGKENAGYHTYQFTMDENVGKRIELFKLIKDTDLLELEEAGVFGSRYRLIEPNYRGIYNGIEIDTTEDDDESQVHDKKIIGASTNAYYHDAMSIATHLQQNDVVYEYADFFTGNEDADEDADADELIAANPLLGKKIEGGRENPAFGRLVDTVYGYFDTSYLYKPFPTKNDDYASGRQNKYMWQTMFDMTEFPYKFNSKTGELGLKIIVDARNEVEKGKLAYAVLSDLKEQWNRYRHSVCCDNTVGGNKFLAMLVGATGGVTAERNLIPFGLSGGVTLDNLYRYSFVEVDVWPKVLVPQGITVGALGLTADDLTDVTYDNFDTFEYYDYITQVDINPSTGEHEIYFAGNSAGSEGITLSFGLPNIAGADDPGAGQEYRINQEQEFFVVPVRGGRRGLFTSYNTMELTNNKAFTGAGINKKGFNYPAGFGLMPIGGMTSGRGAGEGTTPIPSKYMGSIVEMSSVQSSDLNEIKTNASSAAVAYEPPSELEETGPNAVVGLLNHILGTKNLPTTFGGSTAELSLIDPDTKQVTTLERDDKDDRPDISDNASPQPKKGVLETTNSVVYLFTAENDHDGKCTT